MHPLPAPQRNTLFKKPTSFSSLASSLDKGETSKKSSNKLKFIGIPPDRGENSKKMPTSLSSSTSPVDKGKKI